ncbi:MAG TPA: hypothetical protein VK941_14885 [Gillisia sp.]|nr:hypothetical protein [Gillisia sp.]
MRNLLPLFSLILVAIFFSSCAGNKGLQEKAPAQFQQAYSTTDAASVKLFIPVSAIQSERVELDSVYFRGRKAPLIITPERPGVYMANFDTGKPDIIMHEDPREEYGNKVPEVPVKVPFDIDDDEAVIVFTENNTTKFYKITGIEQR